MDERFKVDELGVEVGVVWMVYADSEDDFPKRDVVAAANISRSEKTAGYSEISPVR